MIYDYYNGDKWSAVHVANFVCCSNRGVFVVAAQPFIIDVYLVIVWNWCLTCGIVGQFVLKNIFRKHIRLVVRVCYQFISWPPGFLCTTTGARPGWWDPTKMLWGFSDLRHSLFNFQILCKASRNCLLQAEWGLLFQRTEDIMKRRRIVGLQI